MSLQMSPATTAPRTTFATRPPYPTGTLTLSVPADVVRLPVLGVGYGVDPARMMGRVGDRVSVRVAKPLRRPKMTFAMFENADDSRKHVEAP